MKKSKRWFLNNAWGLIGLALAAPASGGTSASADGSWVLTKTLAGPAGGVGLQGGNFSMSFGWGELAAAGHLAFSQGALESGYYGGRFGAGQTFSVVATQVGGAPTYFQEGLQIGVTIQASIRVELSDSLDPDTLSTGLQAVIVRDHLANFRNEPVTLRSNYDPSGRTLFLEADPAWRGNTLYDIVLAPDLRSVNSYPLNGATHIRFLTMADPHEENVVLSAMDTDLPAAPAHGPQSLRVEIQPESLSDYSVLLFNSDPLKSPWRVDPAILQEANRKAQASGGTYQTPVGLLEIMAYNPQGQILRALSRPAQISFSYATADGWVSDTPVPVHGTTLALWTLDPEHRLWVKIPASVASGQTVQAPITRLSVFALMGSASGSATDAFVFPTPWRPHGPNAGTGPGQTGTEQGGLTFSNLPSESSIKIYTLNGEQVRELHHSDIAGPMAQETWDGNTAGGAHAASGVYLWRVESTQDGKSGKLMIIR